MLISCNFPVVCCGITVAIWNSQSMSHVLILLIPSCWSLICNFLFYFIILECCSSHYNRLDPNLGFMSPDTFWHRVEEGANLFFLISIQAIIRVSTYFDHTFKLHGSSVFFFNPFLKMNYLKIELTWEY